MQVIREDGSKPIKAWVNTVEREWQITDSDEPIKFQVPDIEDSALTQLKNIARLPFIHNNGVAVMPDVHAGIGATVGSVIATEKAVIPSAVGVDIGCGMNAVRLSLKATDLPDSLLSIRHQIERDVPLGKGGEHKNENLLPGMSDSQSRAIVDNLFGGDRDAFCKKAGKQLGSLGSGNHFIELCIDENQDVWVMLHSGSRGIGNMIGSYFIEKAKRTMEQYWITLPDADLAYIPDDTDDFNAYVEAVDWAQQYALENRRLMMEVVIAALRRHIPKQFAITQEAINCHHNYIAKENHFGRNLWVTRKGAIRAREGDLGIIPAAWGNAAISSGVRVMRNRIAHVRTELDGSCPGQQRSAAFRWQTLQRRLKGLSAARMRT